MYWPDGAMYDGEWSLGHAHGRGKFIDQLGNVYEGEFYMSMTHGYGVYVNTMGSSYTGYWKFDR